MNTKILKTSRWRNNPGTESIHILVKFLIILHLSNQNLNQRKFYSNGQVGCKPYFESNALHKENLKGYTFTHLLMKNSLPTPPQKKGEEKRNKP